MGGETVEQRLRAPARSAPPSPGASDSQNGALRRSRSAIGVAGTGLAERARSSAFGGGVIRIHAVRPARH